MNLTQSLTPSPNVTEVPGARAKIEILSEVPCGKLITTQFVDAAGKLLRQDQHVIADSFEAMVGATS